MRELVIVSFFKTKNANVIKELIDNSNYQYDTKLINYNSLLNDGLEMTM